jgi:hypothetical protein
MERTWKVIESKELSEDSWNKRYVVVDIETGEVLDNAQGYGYKSVQKAYAGYGYKTRDKSKDAEKAEKHRIIQNWCKEHKSFVRDLEDYAFHIWKGSYGPDEKFNAELVRKMFNNYGYTDLPFTAGEFLRYWDKPLKQKNRGKKKKRQ